MSYELFIISLQQGLILSFVAFSIMISFRILNYSDLSAEGLFPFSAVLLTASLISGLNIYIALIIAIFLSGFVSIIICLISHKMKLNFILSCIMVSTMIYSVNLRLLAKPNISLFEYNFLFNRTVIYNIILLSIISAVTKTIFYLFLKTQIGLKLRSVGLNQKFAESNGISVLKYSMLGLFIAGCFSSLGGVFMAQTQLYTDVNMGVGIVIHGLAALMLGEVILGNNTNLKKQLIAPLFGAILYQQIQGFVISMGLAPTDIKFFTGTVLICIIGLNLIKTKTKTTSA